MDFRNLRDRKVQVRWQGGPGRTSRIIWVRDLPALIRRLTPYGAHSFEWRDLGKIWKKVP